MRMKTGLLIAAVTLLLLVSGILLIGGVSAYIDVQQACPDGDQCTDAFYKVMFCGLLGPMVLFCAVLVGRSLYVDLQQGKSADH